MIVPAYAWYWRYSGDDLYRERGDQMFGNAMNTDISYSGKTFSQNYRWSFRLQLLQPKLHEFRKCDPFHYGSRYLLLAGGQSRPSSKNLAHGAPNPAEKQHGHN